MKSHPRCPPGHTLPGRWQASSPGTRGSPVDSRALNKAERSEAPPVCAEEACVWGRLQLAPVTPDPARDTSSSCCGQPCCPLPWWLLCWGPPQAEASSTGQAAVYPGRPHGGSAVQRPDPQRFWDGAEGAPTLQWQHEASSRWAVATGCICCAHTVPVFEKLWGSWAGESLRALPASCRTLSPLPTRPVCQAGHVPAGVSPGHHHRSPPQPSTPRPKRPPATRWGI